MISPENLKAFFRRWLTNFIDAATSSLNLLGIIAAFITVFGLALTAPQYKLFAVIFLGLYLLFIAVRTCPEINLHPANFVSQRIDVDRLKNFVIDIARIGLIGKQNVGKTTFLDLTVARTAENEQTERPYAQIVALPDTAPITYVAIIDSVGQRDHIQFDIQNHSDLVLLFLDHSESSDQQAADRKRIEQQVYFVSQLIAAKQNSATGGEVEKYYRDGRIKDIAEYCESDVVNTYRVWLRYELFRGKLTKQSYEASEENLNKFLEARNNATRQLKQTIEYDVIAKVATSIDHGS